MPEISTETILAMDERNRGDIDELKKGQEKINETLLLFHGTLSRIDERLKDQKGIKDELQETRDDVQKAKGMGKVAAVLLGALEGAHWIFHR